MPHQTSCRQCWGLKTDRQTDRQTDSETDRQDDRQTDRQEDRQADRQTGRQTGRQADRQILGLKNTENGRALGMDYIYVLELKR